jgi:small nuclear ribonucleoprotein F
MAAGRYLHPEPFLSSLIDQPIVVRLKWGMEYVGFLVSFDTRMNVHLRNAQEFIGGELQAEIGDILIRCNNIMHIRPKPAAYPESAVPAAARIEDDSD